MSVSCHTLNQPSSCPFLPAARRRVLLGTFVSWLRYRDSNYYVYLAISPTCLQVSPPPAPPTTTHLPAHTQLLPASPIPPHPRPHTCSLPCPPCRAHHRHCRRRCHSPSPQLPATLGFPFLHHISSRDKKEESLAWYFSVDE